jgi:hypothetical protein
MYIHVTCQHVQHVHVHVTCHVCKAPRRHEHCVAPHVRTCVAPRRHEHSLSPVECAVIITLLRTYTGHMKPAGQPHPALEAANDCAAIVVKAAAVAEHGRRRIVPHGVRHNVAPRRHPVLKRHVTNGWRESVSVACGRRSLVLVSAIDRSAARELARAFTANHDVSRARRTSRHVHTRG